MHKLTAPLLEGSRVQVKIGPGLRQNWRAAKVLEVLPHHYRVQLESPRSVVDVPKSRVRGLPEPAPSTPKTLPLRPDAAIETRKVVTSHPPPRAVPKPLGRVTDREYLAFVHTLSCCACRRTDQIEAHHFGERAAGRKTHDYNSTPCCSECHHHFHATGTFRNMTRIETEHAIYKGNRDALVAWLIATRVHVDGSPQGPL